MAGPRGSTQDPGGATGSSRLDALLVEAVAGAEAQFGIVYVFAPGRRLLLMEATTGLPAGVARAWARVGADDRLPVAVSVRERRLVWVGDRQALAREFPAAALTLPYHLALAAAPIRADEVHADAQDGVLGGVVLGWSTTEQAGLSRDRLDAIDTACAGLARLLAQAGTEDRGSRPRLLSPVRARDPGPAALAWLNCLPEGYCHVDEHAYVTHVTAPAAELLATRPSDLAGRSLWQALPWLDSPTCEDRYRAAIVSRQPTRFTARHPDGRRLSFQCHPNPSGMIIRITPAGAAEAASADDAGRHPRMVTLHDMLHLATSLARARTVQDVVNLVADHVMPLCEVQAMALLTWDSGRMRVIASRGYSRRGLERFEGHPVVRAAPWARDRPRDEAVFFSTWEEFHRAYPGALRVDDMGSWALLPLTASGRSIGTCVLAHDRPHHFREDERDMLTALGGLITQAFERAWLYDKKHRLAQVLQTDLLPGSLPDVPGLDVAARYVPATPGVDIGGDFYDLIRLTDTQAAAVIGDVQGHDMAAAALMGQVRTAIHTYATAGAGCGEVLAHTNRLMTELAPDRFTSCLYLTLDLDDQVACLASAGHLPPLLSHPGVPTQVVDASPGLLLGIDPDAEYEVTHVRLPPGSVLTLYTDGLVERPGRDLGEAIAALAARFTPAPDRPLHGVARSLVEAAGDGQRTDDTAILLLRNARR
ncbi:MAG: SpoIIE family protein phosphatase [Nonomuraea sp.]|nr:SpoIIE family protein phosphatase [Nonomuraea sp.]